MKKERLYPFSSFVHHHYSEHSKATIALKCKQYDINPGNTHRPRITHYAYET